MPNLALSSCWNSHRHTDGYEMLSEIAGLGFTHVELSHGIRIVLVPGIIRAIEEGVIQVASTHNFCPLPTGVMHAAPNYFEPSALHASEHEQWIRYTTRSIDFAAQVNARLIVMHLGSVRFLWLNPEHKIDAYQEQHPDTNLREDAAYKTLLAKSLARLRKHAPKYYERMKASLTQVLAHAAEKNISLGLENREAFTELPIDDSFPDLFAALPSPNTCGYWHDVGHANLKENLGILNHREHLQQNADRLLGFHLHDVSKDNHDHQPIGTGRIDFDMIAEFFRPHHLFTLELSPRTRSADVRSSKELIQARIDKLPPQ